MDDRALQFLYRYRGVTMTFADRNGLVLWTRGETAPFFGSVGELVGRSLLDLVPELSDEAETFSALVAGDQPVFEIPWINRQGADGQSMYYSLTLVPWRNNRNQIVGLIQVTEDVSAAGLTQRELVQRSNELSLLQDELQRRNLALAAANAELRRLGEIKSEFLGIAAHELRTPLALILGYLELLIDGAFGPLNPEQRERLELTHANAERLTRLVNDLLDATRLELGHLELVLQPADVSEIVRRVIEEIAPQAAAREQQVEYHAATHLPLVMCDSGRTGQILTNLLSNASHYSPSRTAITVTAEYAAEDGVVRLSVADQGMGIAPGDREHIFALFQRGQNAERRGMQGTGLGLSISRALAELQGGRIWFESELGHGSTFYVTIPIAEM